MRNRLIAAILGLCGAVTGVQAAPNVTSEITYDLASGRADYYFWNEEPPPEVSYSTTFSFFQCSYPDSQQTCTSAGNTSVVQIYLTEKRSGMRWPVKLKGYMTVQVWEDGPCKGWYDKKRLDDGTGYQCKDTINNVGYLAKTKVLTLYIEQEEMKKLPIGGLWEGKVKLHFSYPATDYQAVDSIGQRNSYVKTWGCGGFLNETNIYSRGKSLCF